MTLRARLLLLVLAVLLPTAGLVLWVVSSAYLREAESSQQRLRETVRALSLVVDREFDKRAAVARTLASSPAIAAGDWQAFHAQARAATQDTGSWIVLVDHDDQLLNTSVPFGTPLPKRSWTPDRSLADGDRVEVSNLRIGPVTRQPVLAVFAPERHFSPARYNVGVVFSPAALQAIVAGQHLPPGWTAEIADREHRIVARVPDIERWLGQPLPAALSSALRARADGRVDAVALDGVLRSAFFSRSPVHGWSFIIGVPQEALTEAARTAAWRAAAAAALLGAFALALATWAARRIREPIAMLERAARQLERDVVPDLPPSGLAEADAVGTALRRAGMQAALDLSERQHAIDELRRGEESQRLLVQINDATRGLSDPVQVQWEIVCRVGRHFGASRCTYGEIEADQQSFSIHRDYTHGVASMAGRHSLEDYGAQIIEQLRAGRSVAMSDRVDDARVAAPAVQAAYERIDTRAMLAVPLVKDARLVAVLVLHDSRPRPFSAEDVALLEQLAERSWFAVENARAASALRESRDVLSLAMRSGRMGAWSRDLIADRVWWSRELEEIFGLEPGTFGGRVDAFRLLVHPEDRARLAQAIARALETREDYSVEFRFHHASGDWRWMEGRGRAVYGADGRPTMLYGLGIDIHDRKHIEQELRRLNAELSDADRRKDEFLATLAHELRNPLAPITNALEILRLKDPADAETRWTRDVIDRQVRQMTRLVDDLLDVARITRGKIQLRLERVTLAGIVHGAIEAARPFIEASGHTLDVRLPAEPVWLEADATRLTQVLLNLLNNAAKYTPRGGRIEVEAAAAGEAAITVRDNGIGIAAEHLARVFEMFSQVAPALERSQGGLGIGLALARGLVDLHGGRIEAHSGGVGCGSEFIVRLPLAPAQVVPAPAAGPAPAGARQRVLVVDDNRDAADSLAMMLELSGHQVAIAHDGEGALTHREAFDPDVVLLDIGMPGMNGYEVARRWREAGGTRTRIVALTGWGQEDDKRRAVAAGFDHHLTKPVDPDRLLAVLHAGADVAA
ncbi:ATP-binding protein [Piscinibacter sp. XHJ-5]|uniref:ATP-binding protein n=1 Tax=Piscinibacter sp. XHJ-5 TaxID=3037797 RepID=UPI00245295BE|nr:ATP-binding protein [Piscinibacter sp. XHJ-5]